MRVAIIAEKGSAHGADYVRTMQEAGHDVVLLELQRSPRAWARYAWRHLRAGSSIPKALSRRRERIAAPDIDVERRAIRKIGQAVQWLYQADVGLAPDVGYIPPFLLTRPRHGFLNAHPGWLPEYRGNNPIEWAVLRGEVTAITVHEMTGKVDAGPYYWRDIVPRTEGASLDEHRAHRGRVGRHALAAVIGRLPAEAKEQEEWEALYWPPLPNSLLPLVKARWNS